MYTYQGFTYQEIQEVERSLDLTLPGKYKTFLNRYGKIHKLRLDSWVFFDEISHIIGLNLDFLDAYSSNMPLHEHEGKLFCFCEFLLDDIFLFFVCDGNNDPLIYSFDKYEPADRSAKVAHLNLNSFLAQLSLEPKIIL